MDGEDLANGVFIISVILILAGLGIAITGGIGTGLMLIGGGCILAGIGGSVHFETRYVIISGGGGFVLLLVGAFFDYISDLMGS